jgi:MFS family permease
VKKHRYAINSVFFANGFVFANWASRIPLIQETFNISHQQLGFVLLSASLGSLVAMPTTGWLISKQGSRRITQISAILYLAIVPLMQIMPIYQALMELFFVMGMTTGTLDVAMNAQAVIVEKLYKRPIMSFFHALFSAGMMIGAATGALFSYLEFPLITHFSIVVGAALLLMISQLRNFISDPPSEAVEDTTFFRLPKASLIGIGLIAFCGMLGEGAMSDWSSNYMTRIVGAAKSTAPIALFAFSLAMTICRFLGDRVRSALGDSRLMFIAGLIASAGILLITLSPNTVLSIVGFFLVGVGLSTVVPIAYSQAGSEPGLAPGVGIGMVTTIGYSGFLFGPPIIGFIADAYDLRIAFFFILGLFLIMTLLVVRQAQMQKSRTD